MTAPARCPRCSGPLRAPGLMSSAWTCATHGEVAPYAECRVSALPGLLSAAVPVWAPVPVLPGWTVTGAARAGSERSGAVAAATAWSGPSPLGGPADLVLLAEEPGTGLGARLAACEDLEPGTVTAGQPDEKVVAAGHPTALWRCPSAADRTAFVGEAGGVWLWAVLWPAAAELVLLEHVELVDLRAAPEVVTGLPAGAPTTRLH